MSTLRSLSTQKSLHTRQAPSLEVCLVEEASARRTSSVFYRTHVSSHLCLRLHPLSGSP